MMPEGDGLHHSVDVTAEDRSRSCLFGVTSALAIRYHVSVFFKSCGAHLFSGGSRWGFEGANMAYLLWWGVG